jgi:hypothetical protein
MRSALMSRIFCNLNIEQKVFFFPLGTEKLSKSQLINRQFALMDHIPENLLFDGEKIV